MRDKRRKTVWVFGCSLVFITLLSIFKTMPEVAVIGTAAIGGIIAKYNNDETKRPSNK